MRGVSKLAPSFAQNSDCKLLMQLQVQPNHGGGFYVCESMEILLGMGRLPSSCAKLLSPWCNANCNDGTVAYAPTGTSAR